MSNDLSTLNGALLEMKDQLIYELGQKGVTASYDSSTGLLGLIGEISNIQTGGSCYHIEFSEDSYTAVGGSATLEIYLQENYAPKVGVTVTVTGSDSSLYTSITNNDGIAQVTVTNVSGTVSFTCTYSNVSDVCTVIGQTYLFYDSCASDNTSQYTNFYEIWASQSTIRTSLSFSTDHYVLTNSNTSFSAVCLPVSTGLDEWKLTAKIRLLTNSTNKGGGVGVATKKEKGLAIFQPNGTSKHLILNNYQGAISSNVAVNNLSTNDYNTFELIKSGQSLTFSIYDATGTQRFTKQITVATNTDYSNCIPCISIAQSDSVYIKEIKLESL